MKYIRYTIFIVVLGLITGCASTRQFVKFPDQNKKLDNPQNARLYVIRPAIFGSGLSMSIKDGEIEIGKTGPQSYLSWEREPGETQISAKGENRYSLDLTVEKGMTYYILQQIKMGFMTARTQLELIDPVQALELLKKCSPPSIINPPSDK